MQIIDTTLMAENEEELKSLLMRAEEESKNIGLKLNIQGRRRSLELGWGAEATEGPCGLRGSPDPARPSSLARRRLCGRKSNRCLCSFHRPRLSGRRAPAGQPSAPEPPFGSCRADAAAGPGFGL